ncbi:hypothetical protein EHM82_00825 [bacterium]|nr:MAG: hypothetical protein EHM82_00825 [bacterium]
MRYPRKEAGARGDPPSLAALRALPGEGPAFPGLLLGSEPAQAELSPKEEAAFDAVFKRVFRRVLKQERHVRAELAQAALAAPLLAGGGAEAMQNLPLRMGFLAKMEALLARSWELRHENPPLMVQFANAAVWCADRLDARRYGVDRVADLQCRAHAELGNAWRVRDQFQSAARELGIARELFEVGTRDVVLEMRLIELEASLAADRRQFNLASMNLRRVYRYYRRLRDDHRAGRILILRGLYTGYEGEPEEGFQLLERGLALIEEARDPGLAYAARHNQLMFLIDCGRFKDAKRFRLRHSRQLANHHGRVNEIRFRWLEGRIEAGFQRYERAEVIFREVKAAFEEEVKRAFHAALVSLDLSAVLLALGKEGEAKELVEQAAIVFFGLQIEREALASVIVLRGSFEENQASAALAQEVADFVRRAAHDPDAVFRPKHLR